MKTTILKRVLGLSGLLFTSMAGSVSADVLPVREPTMEFTETLNVQALADHVGDLSAYPVSEAKVVRKFTAVVQGQEEVFIPLGVFKNASIHNLVINASGPFANSALSCEFMVLWNQEFPVVNNMSQFASHSQFELYSYKHGTAVGLVLRYKNVDPQSTRSNTVTIAHANTSSGSWQPWDLGILDTGFIQQDNEFQQARILTGNINQATKGNSNIYNKNLGITIKDTVGFVNDVTFEQGNVRVKGALIIEQPGGDISMGPYQ